MIAISLKQFVLTGGVGPVKVGMHKNKVIELLGTPEGDTDFGLGFSVLIYGKYEFFYETKTEILKSIQNDYLQAFRSDHGELILFKNDKFEVDIWFLKVGFDIDYKAVIEKLNQEQIKFSEEELYDCYIIKFESGVTMDFEQKNEDYLLNGLRYFPDLN